MGVRPIEGEGDAELIKNGKLDERGSWGMERVSFQLRQKKTIKNEERGDKQGKV